eukprot:1070228-Rhodomonas_salina.1
MQYIMYGAYLVPMLCFKQHIDPQTSQVKVAVQVLIITFFASIPFPLWVHVTVAQVIAFWMPCIFIICSTWEPAVQDTMQSRTALLAFSSAVGPLWGALRCVSCRRSWARSRRVKKPPVSYTHLRAHETEADL